ncbi:MAG: molybdopterin-dependent oxidoreductase, partial [Gemmatimonadota bacterium]
EVGWADALGDLLQALKDATGDVKAATWAHAPNEEMGLLKALLAQVGGGDVVFRSPRTEGEVLLPGFPLLARREDLAPNVNGAEIFGFERVGNDDAKGGLDELAGHTGVLIVVGDPLEDYGPDFGAQAELFVYLGSYTSEAAAKAHFVLPTTTFAEQEGSYTNIQGRVQRFWPAVRSPGSSRPGWLILGALLAELTETEAPVSADQAFSRVAGEVAEFSGITYGDMGTRGAEGKKSAGVAGD